jgi:hypothetical protein
MCVTKKCDAGVSLNKLGGGIFGGHYIAIFIVRRAMYVLDAGDLVHRDRSFGQMPQPGQMFAVNLLAVPQSRYARDRIEILHSVDSRDHLVMVPANKNSRQRA